MLSRWTRKDAQNGSSSNGSGGDRPDAGSSTGGQLSPTATANGSGSGSYPWPYDKEKHGIDGLTPSERAMLEGLERFYGMENFGNTCYANSVVQALFFCRPFRDCVNTYPSLLVPFAPGETPSGGLSVQIPSGSGSSGDSSMASSPLLAPGANGAVPPLQSPGSTRTSRWPGSKRVLSGGAKGDATDGSSSLEPPSSNNKRDRSRSPSRTRTSLQQPSYPPPATLFAALQSLFQHISSIPAPAYAISPNKDKDGNPPVPLPAVSKVIAPAAFIAKLKVENVMFQGTMQQDAHEFLNFLLNKIGEDLAAEDRERRAAAKARSLAAEEITGSTGSVSTAGIGPVGQADQTFVQKLFEGTLVNETRCLTCETTSSRDESFLDLSIDIEQNTSVTSCLRQFSASETLCQRNKFYCDTCCGLQEAEKRMKIKTLPNVLALHLKRFKYQEDLGRYIKLSYRVVFPFHLRLPNTSEQTDNPDRLYELFAFVVHIGGGPHHGHYIAIVKTSAGWMMFDDVNVSPVDEADIQRYFGESTSGSGYVLFYQAVDLDPASLGLRDRNGAPAPANQDMAAPRESAAPRPIPTLHLSSSGQRDETAAAPAPLGREIATPSPPPATPTPSEVDGDPTELRSAVPEPKLPRERFASAPAVMPSLSGRSKSEYDNRSHSGDGAGPEKRASPSRRHSQMPRVPSHESEDGQQPARRPSMGAPRTSGHSRKASSSGVEPQPPIRRPSGSPAPFTQDLPDPNPIARRRFSSIAIPPAGSTGPPSQSTIYLQSLVTGKPKIETKEEKKAREALEKERERAQKEREKLGREREKEREKAEKEREKQRREEEKAEAARVAKMEKEAERRIKPARKASLGRTTSLSFLSFGKKNDGGS